MLALLAAGCGGRRDAFLQGRAQDACDASWPICDGVAGCILGPESFVEGRFPGSGKFIVHTFEPSTVAVSFFLEDVGAAGEETAITWYEDRCRSKVRKTAVGKTFVGETQQQGFFTREAELTGTGDHLVEYQSDARATYLVKVDVTPKRIQ